MSLKIKDIIKFKPVEYEDWKRFEHLADLDEGVDTNLPIQKQRISGGDILSLYNIEDFEMKKGGNPLMELKYGIGD